MIKLLLVFVGGGLGSVLRYSAGLMVAKMTPVNTEIANEPPHWLSMYPIATLLVNVIGCALIGIVWGLLGDPEDGNETMRVALIVGLLGGFTTFSSFGWETLDLINNGRFGTAMGYVLLSVAAGLIAAWGGHAVGVMIGA